VQIVITSSSAVSHWQSRCGEGSYIPHLHIFENLRVVYKEQLCIKRAARGDFSLGNRLCGPSEKREMADIPLSLVRVIDELYKKPFIS